MSIDLSTVTDDDLCRSAEMNGDPLMWELAKRFREASAIAAAAREAGLVGKDGKLKPPTCYWKADGDGVSDAEDDIQCSYDPGCVVAYQPAWGGRLEWWTLDTDDQPLGPFATKQEAEAAADAAKGGGDD